MNILGFLQKIVAKLFNRDNLGARLICLCLAVGFWIYVMTEQNPIAERSLEARLLQVNLASDMMVYNVPDKVEVRVRGNRARLNDGVETHLNVFIDLKGVESGRQTLPVRAIYDEGEVVAVKPDRVTVYLDTVSQKTMPLEVRQTGKAEMDYALSSVKLTPQEVMVQGPTHRIDQVEKVVATVDVTERLGSFAAESKLLALGEDGQEVPSAKVLPAKAMVEGTMVRQLLTVDLPVELVTSGHLQRGLRLVSAETTPATVRLTAPPSVLNELTSVKTMPLDISRLTVSMSPAVDLDLPAKAICRTKLVQVHLVVERSN